MTQSPDKKTRGPSLRVPEQLEERLRIISTVMGISAQKLAAQCIGEMLDMMQSDERAMPPIVLIYDIYARPEARAKFERKKP